jgi:hypothetical protein
MMKNETQLCIIPGSFSNDLAGRDNHDFEKIAAEKLSVI